MKTHPTKMYLVCALSVALTVTTVRSQESYRGTYRATVSLPERDTRVAGQGNVWAFTVTDRSGAVRTTIQRVMPFDVAAPQAVVFENGRVLLLHSFDAYGELFDVTGDLIRRFALIDDPTPEYERVIRCGVHDRSAAVAISGDGEVVLLSIDAEGNRTERRRLQAMTVTGVAVADDPSLVAVGTMSWKNSDPAYRTTFVSEVGDWSVSAGSERGMFGEDARFVAIDDRGVSVVSLNSRTVEWSHPAGPGRMVVDVALSDGDISVLTAARPQWTGGAWWYAAPVVRTFDASGAVVLLKDLSGRTFRTGSIDAAKPKPVLIFDGKRIE